MTTAIFTVVDAVLLRPVPFPEPERLLMVWETDRQTSTTHEPSSFPDFVDFQKRSRTIESFGAFVVGDANLTPPAGDPTRVAVVYANSGFLPLLGAKPLAGRLFTADEDRRRGPDVIVISDRLWERLFQRDPAALGGIVRINGRARTVIGVLPTDSDFGLLQMLSAADYSRGFADRDGRTRVDLWAPLQGDEETLPRRTHPLLVVGRLAPAATVQAAQEELTAIAADLEKAYPADNEARGVFVEHLSDVIFGPVEPAMLLLLAAVATVLLISCVNVAHLLMARGATRLREVAVRSVLGADLRRLARQFVIENTVLTIVSAVLGTALVLMVLKVLVVMAPANIPRLAAASVDARVLGVALVLSIVVGLTFGLLPVAQARRVNLLVLLNNADSRAASMGPARGHLRSILIVAEMALAAMLAIASGLLIKSFWQIRQVDPGFAVAGVLKAEFQLPPTRYPVDFRRPDFAAIHRFNDTLLARVAALPGVESAALAGNHPLDTGFTSSFRIVGREAESATFPEISIRRVTHEYFTTLRVPLVRGRLLEEADGANAQPVVVINEVAAKQFFSAQDPIGQRLEFYGTIVGVVGGERIFGVAKSPPIALYLPLARLPSPNGAEALIVRTSGNPSGLASAVQRAIRETDSGLAVFGVEPLADALSASVGDARFVTLLVALFAGLALLLAAIGVHGVLSYDIAQRVPRDRHPHGAGSTTEQGGSTDRVPRRCARCYRARYRSSPRRAIQPNTRQLALRRVRPRPGCLWRRRCRSRRRGGACHLVARSACGESESADCDAGLLARPTTCRPRRCDGPSIGLLLHNSERDNARPGGNGDQLFVVEHVGHRRSAFRRDCSLVPTMLTFARHFVRKEILGACVPVGRISANGGADGHRNP